MSQNAFVLGFMLALVAPAATADTLLIQRVGVEESASLPRRGVSMSQVEAQFGAPERRLDAVGGGSAATPPITRWQYHSFSVYFENSHVVDAVLNKASPLEVGPAPVGN